MRRGVKNLDVGVGTRHLDLHHRVRLGYTTIATLAVPVRGTLTIKGVTITIDYT
jgi:hypothetical protein